MNCATLARVFKGDNLNVLVGQVSGLFGNFNIAIFSDTINWINVKLCMKVLHIELYMFITCSVTLALFKGHSNLKQFKLKISSSYPIQFKFRSIVQYIKQVMNIQLFFTFPHIQGR